MAKELRVANRWAITKGQRSRAAGGEGARAAEKIAYQAWEEDPPVDPGVVAANRAESTRTTLWPAPRSGPLCTASSFPRPTYFRFVPSSTPAWSAPHFRWSTFDHLPPSLETFSNLSISRQRWFARFDPRLGILPKDRGISSSSIMDKQISFSGEERKKKKKEYARVHRPLRLAWNRPRFGPNETTTRREIRKRLTSFSDILHYLDRHARGSGFERHTIVGRSVTGMKSISAPKWRITPPSYRLEFAVNRSAGSGFSGSRCFA